MQNLASTQTTIIKNFTNKLLELRNKLEKNLVVGDFKGFEESLKLEVDNLYDDLSKSIITDVLDTDEMENKAKEIGKKLNLSVRKTTVKITLCTGTEVTIPSYYGTRHVKKKEKNNKRGPNGSGRHLLLDYWGFIGKASPRMYSTLTLLTVICPSYDVCKSVLSSLKIKIDSKKIRRIVLLVGEKSSKSLEHRVKLILDKGETASGKSLIISVDGGRTRTRKDKIQEETDNKYKKFDTPWKEPKLLVIQELDKNGEISRNSLPIYDTVMGSADELFGLLKEYLIQLNIKSVDKVLFIADGARWIWKRVKSLLKEIGLKEEQYVLAIDYYHAAQQLHKIIEEIPGKNFEKIEVPRKQTNSQNTDNETLKIVSKNKIELFKELKNYLWKGKIDYLVKIIKTIGKGNLQKIKELLGYFTNQKELFNYEKLRDLNLPCGSGIIESAVRRVINLRFKSPSSFWIPKNVEQLMFFRGIALAKRWDIFINNLTISIL